MPPLLSQAALVILFETAKIINRCKRKNPFHKPIQQISLPFLMNKKVKKTFRTEKSFPVPFSIGRNP